MPSTARSTIWLFVALLATAGCASDRAHWSGGRKYDLVETSRVHVRRSRQTYDEERREIELSWVAARARDGAADLVMVELTVFDDENDDGRAQEGEIVKRLESRERARKIQFSGLRFPWSVGTRPLKASLVARSGTKNARTDWTLVPD